MSIILISATFCSFLSAGLLLILCSSNRLSEPLTIDSTPNLYENR